MQSWRIIKQQLAWRVKTSREPLPEPESTVLDADEMDAAALKYVRATYGTDYVPTGPYPLRNPPGTCYWIDRPMGRLTGPQPPPVFVHGHNGHTVQLDILAAALRAYRLHDLRDIKRLPDLARALSQPDRDDPRQVPIWNTILEEAIRAAK